MDSKKTETLQELCRSYLSKLKSLAQKHGLGSWTDETIEANLQGRCVATEEEVCLLSRCIDDERLKRTDVPKILGKSYRQSVEDEDFDKIAKLDHVGIYSKVDTLLYKAKNEEKR